MAAQIAEVMGLGYLEEVRAGSVAAESLGLENVTAVFI
jgi:hypothetical protein